MKYSILFPFYNRATLLENTLKSFCYHYNYRKDYEVIILNDYKNTEDIDGLVDQFSKKEIIIRQYTIAPPSTDRDYYNPTKAFNLGASVASGKFLVISNPEICHESDVLSGLDECIRHDDLSYVVCACKSVEGLSGEFPNVSYEFEKWYENSSVSGWDRKFHFCSMLKKSSFINIGGFDVGYMNGIGYDDDDFIQNIQDKGIRVVCRDDLITLHQHHDREYSLSQEEYNRLYQLNCQYFLNKWGKMA